MNGHLRPTLLGRLRRVELKIAYTYFTECFALHLGLFDSKIFTTDDTVRRRCT